MHLLFSIIHLTGCARVSCFCKSDASHPICARWPDIRTPDLLLSSRRHLVLFGFFLSNGCQDETFIPFVVRSPARRGSLASTLHRIICSLSTTMIKLLRHLDIRHPVRISRILSPCDIPSTSTMAGCCSTARARALPIRAMSSTSQTSTPNPRPTPQVPRPSATAIVVNSQNEILLVHRNPKSSSFANAHVG